MVRYRIEFSDSEARQFEKLAKEAGTTVEELLRRIISIWLVDTPQDLSKAASYVLEKNAGLYTRLSSTDSLN